MIKFLFNSIFLAKPLQLVLTINYLYFMYGNISNINFTQKTLAKAIFTKVMKISFVQKSDHDLQYIYMHIQHYKNTITNTTCSYVATLQIYNLNITTLIKQHKYFTYVHISRIHAINNRRKIACDNNRVKD